MMWGAKVLGSVLCCPSGCFFGSTDCVDCVDGSAWQAHAEYERMSKEIEEIMKVNARNGAPMYGVGAAGPIAEHGAPRWAVASLVAGQSGQL